MFCKSVSGSDGMVSELFRINDTYMSTSPLAISYKAFIEWKINIWQANAGDNERKIAKNKY